MGKRRSSGCKRRTYPSYLSRDEYEREEVRLQQMVDGITGTRGSVEDDPPAIRNKPRESAAGPAPNRPKASFGVPLNETDSLQLTVWAAKKDPEAEVIVAEIQSRQEANWKSLDRIAIYRSSDGRLSRLPERPRT